MKCPFFPEEGYTGHTHTITTRFLVQASAPAANPLAANPLISSYKAIEKQRVADIIKRAHAAMEEMIEINAQRKLAELAERHKPPAKPAYVPEDTEDARKLRDFVHASYRFECMRNMVIRNNEHARRHNAALERQRRRKLCEDKSNGTMNYAVKIVRKSM